MEMETTDASAAKRKRSPSSAGLPSTAPAPKATKTSSNQLSINYLARQSQEDLPLIGKDDSLPNLIHLLSSYSNVLDRHESLASNLGARPLGPILIKRFERCFETPPKVVTSHHRSGSTNPEDSAHHITWLEVIEFARSHPSQFTLSTFSEGKRVCQFYYPQKQLRVQISEEDFLFINSGRCQELIPPLPIWEDEEKEVGTCDVLEAKLKELTNAADMVAARTRQLSHRLKGRRAAILERRAEGGSGTLAKASALQTTTAPPSSSSSGFTAVNAAIPKPTPDLSEPALGSSTAVRNELLRHFESLPHNQNQGRSQARSSIAEGVYPSIKNADGGRPDSAASSLSPVPTSAFTDPLSYYVTDGPTLPRQPTNSGHRPSSSGASQAYNTGHTPLKHNFSRPLPPALESSQPFRPLCQAHMDSLPRGQRVLPPCDRCRRLRMDCVKNLTSCAGCTKKHARCHWREVSRDELGALDNMMESAYATSTTDKANGYTNGTGAGDHGYDDGSDDDDDSNPLEDLEALGEKEERENEAAAEQMREDEEGLQKAKELARQSWEDGLKEYQPGDATTAGVQNEDAAKEAEEVAGTGHAAEALLSSTSDGDHVQADNAEKTTPNPPTNASNNDRSEQVNGNEKPAASATNDDDDEESIVVQYGGFRPVNQPMNGPGVTAS